MPSTIRIELDRAEFDWKSGVVLHEQGTGRSSAPGRNTRFLKSTDPILDKDFSNGYAFINIPRVFAKDAKAVYFPHVGANSGARMVRVLIDPENYVKGGTPLPYPGDF